MAEPCVVADQHCTAAANFAFADARGKCFHCGENVCMKCSSRRNFLWYGRVRLCNNCQCDYDGNNYIVMRRISRLAGYDRAPKWALWSER